MKDDIIHMAREAGIRNDCDGIWCNADQLARFAALVRADEREAIARKLEKEVSIWGRRHALAIRARGNT